MIAGARPGLRAGWRQPFGLNGVASLWVVLGCEFALLTRGRLWAGGMVIPKMA